jgi:hypothetical protein
MVEVQLSGMLNAQPLTKVNPTDAKSEVKHKQKLGKETLKSMRDN